MRANSAKTQKQILRDELTKFVEESTPEIVKETEAMVLYALYLENFSQDDIFRIHSCFKSLLNWNEVLGKAPKARDVISFMENSFSINFDDIRPRFEEE